jgi:hypothetical protein
MISVKPHVLMQILVQVGKALWRHALYAQYRVLVVVAATVLVDAVMQTVKVNAH